MPIVTKADLKTAAVLGILYLAKAPQTAMLIYETEDVERRKELARLYMESHPIGATVIGVGGIKVAKKVWNMVS